MKIEFEGVNFEGYIGKVIADEFSKCKCWNFVRR